jgi:hypothetical protein
VSASDHAFDRTALLARLAVGGRPDRLELPAPLPLAVQAELARCGYVATREAPGAYVLSVGAPAPRQPAPTIGFVGAIAERVLEDLPGARAVDPVGVHRAEDLVVVGDATPTGRWVGRLVGVDPSLRRDLLVAVREDGRWRARTAPARVALDPSARGGPGPGRAGAEADAPLRVGVAGLPTPTPAARSWARRLGQGRDVALGGPRRGARDGLVDRVRVALGDLDLLLVHPSAFPTAADRAVTVAVSAWSGVLPVTEDPEPLAPYLSAEVRERLPTTNQLPVDAAELRRALDELGSVLGRNHAADRVLRTLTGLAEP